VYRPRQSEERVTGEGIGKLQGQPLPAGDYAALLDMADQTPSLPLFLDSMWPPETLPLEAGFKSSEHCTRRFRVFWKLC